MATQLARYMVGRWECWRNGGRSTCGERRSSVPGPRNRQSRRFSEATAAKADEAGAGGARMIATRQLNGAPKRPGAFPLAGPFHLNGGRATPWSGRKVANGSIRCIATAVSSDSSSCEPGARARCESLAEPGRQQRMRRNTMRQTRRHRTQASIERVKIRQSFVRRRKGRNVAGC